MHDDQFFLALKLRVSNPLPYQYSVIVSTSLQKRSDIEKKQKNCYGKRSPLYFEPYLSSTIGYILVGIFYGKLNTNYFE